MKCIVRHQDASPIGLWVYLTSIHTITFQPQRRPNSKNERLRRARIINRSHIRAKGTTLPTHSVDNNTSLLILLHSTSRNRIRIRQTLIINFLNHNPSNRTWLRTPIRLAPTNRHTRAIATGIRNQKQSFAHRRADADTDPLVVFGRFEVEVEVSRRGVGVEGEDYAGIGGLAAGGGTEVGLFALVDEDAAFGGGVLGEAGGKESKDGEEKGGYGHVFAMSVLNERVCQVRREEG